MDQRMESAFLTALEQNHQKLLRVCSVYAEDAEDKKDLFQEALINIWQSMPSFEEKSSLSTWMFRVTLNVCLRLQTKQARQTNPQRAANSQLQKIPARHSSTIMGKLAHGILSIKVDGFDLETRKKRM